MYISPNPKFVFVDIAKTGSRSILSFLNANFKGVEGKSHELTIPKQYDDYYKFTVVRNPYDRMASLWWSTCQRNLDKYGYLAKFKTMGLDNRLVNFLTLIKEKYQLGERTRHFHTISQTTYINTNNFDKIIKFENLNEEFNELPFLNSKISLPRLNQTIISETKKNPNLRPATNELINPEAGKLINKICKEEFKLFEYKMEEF